VDEAKVIRRSRTQDRNGQLRIFDNSSVLCIYEKYFFKVLALIDANISYTKKTKK